MAKDTDYSNFEGDAMLDLLTGNEEGFRKRLSKFDPEILSGLFIRSKELGREAYQKGDYAQAIEQYTAALALAPTVNEKAKLFANRSQCYVQTRRFEDGLREAQKAIALDRGCPKAWFRAGRCLSEMSLWEAAQAALQQSLTLVDGGGVEAKEITRLSKGVTEQLEKERKKRRYTTDYTRFQKLAERLVSEEHMEEYEKKLREDAQPEIEYASDLSEEQRRALELQLTGKVAQPEAKVTIARRKGFDLSLNSIRIRQPHHENALRAFLTLQSEGRIADRVIGSANSSVLGLYKQALNKLLSSDVKSLLFCGCETYFLPFRSLASFCRSGQVV